MMEKQECLLVIGGNGLLGHNLVLKALDSNQYSRVVGTYYSSKIIPQSSAEFISFNKADHASIEKKIAEINPTVIVDTGALHKVDYCETHPDESHDVNVKGTHLIAKTAKAINATMVYISTDYVYDGNEENSPFLESQPPSPVNIYAQHKLEAEDKVMKTLSQTIICRPSVIYGWGLNPSKPNFVQWVIQSLKANKPITIVNDQYSHPTFADHFAETILSLISSHQYGVYNTVGKNCLDRYAFTLEIAQIFNLDTNLVKPILTSSLNQKAARPMHCCVSTAKIESAGITLLSSLDGLRKMEQQKVAKSSHKID